MAVRHIDERPLLPIEILIVLGINILAALAAYLAMQLWS